ncbi:MAG: HesB/IscA family protein, partial [Planctomyces sp.]
MATTTQTQPTDAPAQQGVILSAAAAREIQNIIKQQELDADKIRLRVGVKGGGCSGFSYLLDLTEAQKDFDEVF